MTFPHHAQTDADAHDLLREIELCTSRSIAAERDIAVVGGFLAAVHPTSDLIWLNFAVPCPDRKSELGASDITQLRELFRSNGRRLRLEYFESLWPDLGRLLEAGGLVLEGRMPIMICSPQDFKPFSAARVRVRQLTADADDALLREFVATAKAGFGVDPATVEPHEVAEQRQYVQTDVYRCAYGEWRGRMVGVGSLTQVNNELAGIATLAEFRRKGVAATVSSDLLERHFATDRSYAWLSAGSDAARGVYEKIGFRQAGVQLVYIDPPAPSLHPDAA